MSVNRRTRVPGQATKSPRPPAGREAQRRRTRKAIVDATVGLLARGVAPSVHDVAAAADVSRRTVYLYFPTFDQLLLDATVGALNQVSVDRAIAGAPDDDPEERVERMVRALHRVSPETEQLGRRLIRLTVDGPLPADGLRRRGYRRIEWIESALMPWRARMGRAPWRRLVHSLAMIVGWEALIVQRDVCGLTPSEGEALSVWAARTLVRATLSEGAPQQSRSRR
jgi:AcrR family transcriptional regulator